MEIAKQRKHKTNKLFLYFSFGLASLKDRNSEILEMTTKLTGNVLVSNFDKALLIV